MNAEFHLLLGSELVGSRVMRFGSRYDEVTDGPGSEDEARCRRQSKDILKSCRCVIEISFRGVCKCPLLKMLWFSKFKTNRLTDCIHSGFSFHFHVQSERQANTSNEYK